MEAFWQNVAATLNSIGDGTTKPAKSWKTYWNEIKYRARKRETELKHHARGTGGGPPKKNLTDTERKILEIIGQVSYAGNPEVQVPVPHLQNTLPSASTSGGMMEEFILPNMLAESTQDAEHAYATPTYGSTQPTTQTESTHDMQDTPAFSPPAQNTVSSDDESVVVGPRRGRMAQVTPGRQPYQRRRYDDPPVWAQRYEEERLEVDRQRARLLERLVIATEQLVEILRRQFP